MPLVPDFDDSPDPQLSAALAAVSDQRAISALIDGYDRRGTFDARDLAAIGLTGVELDLRGPALTDRAHRIVTARHRLPDRFSSHAAAVAIAGLLVGLVLNVGAVLVGA